MTMRMLMRMPSRNIYVSDSDLDLFDAAAAIAGSMSAAVVAGLRLYVAEHRSRLELSQMRQIDIEVQDGPIVTIKRFTGRQLLRYEIRDGLRIATFRVYLTAGDQFAVHTRNDPGWSRLSSPSENNPVWDDERTWTTQWWKSTHRTLRVFSSLDAAVGELPDEVVQATHRALTEPAIDNLEI